MISDYIGYPDSDEKWAEGKLKKAFLHFLLFFWPYLMIFQSSTLPSVTFGKNDEKPCSTCLKNTFFSDSGSQQSRACIKLGGSYYLLKYKSANKSFTLYFLCLVHTGEYRWRHKHKPPASHKR